MPPGSTESSTRRASGLFLDSSADTALTSLLREIGSHADRREERRQSHTVTKTLLDGLEGAGKSCTQSQHLLYYRFSRRGTETIVSGTTSYMSFWKCLWRRWLALLWKSAASCKTLKDYSGPICIVNFVTMLPAFIVRRHPFGLVRSNIYTFEIGISHLSLPVPWQASSQACPRA